MNIKSAAKRYLGKTPLWRKLSVARYKLGRAARSSALKRYLYGVMPQRFIYALLQPNDIYDATYFDACKDASRESGYEAAYTDMQEFHDVARVAVELFRPEQALDIGCARGFQVRGLVEHAVEAWGVDISAYVVGTAPPDVAPRLSVRGCRDTGFPAAMFDLVLLMETLEHIPPFEINASVEEARRVCGRYILATIPSIGDNPFGPDGVTGGKVQLRYLPIYKRGTVDWVPLRQLAQDVQGFPIHGHLTAASFDWWTGLFTRHGLVRRGDLERRVNESITSASEGVWNCYVLAKAANPAGEPTREIKGPWDWERAGEGLWRTGPVRLPTGLHRAELRLRWYGMPRGAHRLHRVLRCGCLSEDGQAVLGMRTFTRWELSRNPWSRGKTVVLPCASEEERTVRFEVEGYSGFAARPLPLEQLFLFEQ